MIAMLVAFTVATGLVLADSGFRLWFAMGEIGAQRTAAMRGQGGLPRFRHGAAAKVTTRVSYARTGVAQMAPLRAAA